MKERCNSVCWAHRENILYIIDKKGNLIVCDPLKEEFDYVVCGTVLRRNLVNAESADAEVKPHAIGVVIFLRKVILLVRLTDTMAELVTEYHVEAQSCLRPVPFANDSYVAWTETGNLMQVEATGECYCNAVTIGVLSLVLDLFDLPHYGFHSETDLGAKVVDKNSAPPKVIDATFLRTLGGDGDSNPKAFATLDAGNALEVFALYGKTNIMPRLGLPFSCTFLLGHPAVPILSVGTADGRVLCLWVQIAAKTAEGDSKGKDDPKSDPGEESCLFATATIFAERWVSDNCLEFGCYEEVAAEEAFVTGVTEDGAREMFLCSTVKGNDWANKFMTVEDGMKTAAGNLLDRYHLFSLHIEQKNSK